MNLESLLVILIIGAIAGWLAGQIMKGSGFGVMGNIVVGIVGSILGGVVFSLIGLGVQGLVGAIISATVGAVILLFAISLVKKGS